MGELDGAVSLLFCYVETGNFDDIYGAVSFGTDGFAYYAFKFFDQKCCNTFACVCTIPKLLDSFVEGF